MALPLLALPSELAVRTGREAADQKLIGALRDASSRFRAAVHHPVSLVTDETIELDGSGSRHILLPAPPIVAIGSLELDGVPLVHRTDYTFSKATGILRREGGRCWPDRLGCLELVYSHGYDADHKDEDGKLDMLPEDIQSAVLDMAQILLNVTPGLTGKTVLGDSVQFGAAATVGSTQTWTDAVDNYVWGDGDRA